MKSVQSYRREKILRTRNCRRDFIKIYFLKNAKKICNPNNRDLNRDWKNSLPCQFLRSSNSRRYHWILKLFVVTSKSEVWEQNDVWLFYCFNFEIKYGVLESKSPCILLNKNINFDKNKNDKLKVKLWWAGAPARKNRTFFIPFVLSEGNFFDICVLSHCVVCLIHFQNNILLYIKKLFHTLFTLLLKSVQSLQCIHGTIIRTGITYRKIPCYMHD